MANQPNALGLCAGLRADRLLCRLAAIARQQGVRLYLVGGSVRDALRGAVKGISPDWDFAVDRGAVRLARAVADSLAAAFVLLDEQHGVARVVYEQGNRRRQLDFADLRAGTLKEDLRRRDFSINTLCVDVQALAAAPAAEAVLDYWQGAADIRKKIIRAVRPQNLTDDPLRIVRGFSLCSRLGFRFAPQTAAVIPRAARHLDRVAGERLTEELAELLSSGRAFPALRDMAGSGVLQRLVPELAGLQGLDQGAYHHLDAWQHSLETVRQYELLVRTMEKYIGSRAAGNVRRFLSEEISGGRPRGWIVALACLLHDAAKPQTRVIGADSRVHFYTHDVQGARIARRLGRRLKMSGKETALLSRLVRRHVRPGQLVNRRPSPRAVFRFVRDTGGDTISLILLALADRRAMRGSLSRTLVFHEQVLWRLVRQQTAPRQRVRQRLLNGHEIMRLTGIAPGPWVGRILAAMEEAQALGGLKTPAQAAAWVQTQYAGASGQKE